MTTATAIPASDELVSRVQPKSNALLDHAKMIVVETGEQYVAAGSWLTEVVKPLRREIDETFDPAIKQAHSAHKAMLAAKDRVARPVAEAEGLVRSAIARYTRKQELARQEEERRLREEARKREEAERLERAAALEREGRNAAAEVVLNTPMPVANVVLAPSTPQVAGISTREVWRFRIVDPTAVKPAFLVPDEKKIGEIVRSMKGAAAELVGGIEVYTDTTTVVR